MEIKTVTVIGATGTVGKVVSGIFASFGNAKVYMVGKTKEKLAKAKNDAAMSVKAITISNNLITKTLDELEDCISESDLVFESVAEDIIIKKEIHSRINNSANKNCIISTGTSGLSIDELAECYDGNIRNNVLGIHFFNPPYNLTLCELIPSKYNKENKAFIDEVKKYLDNNLHRDTIIVDNSPAFLGNRIGFMCMNEALQLAYEYKDQGGIDYIDTILGRYTGRSMAPLATIDFVGLDIHKAIVDNICANTNNNDKESFILPSFFNELVKENKLGKKIGEGLYKTIDEIKYVYDIKTNKYRESKKYNIEYINKTIEKIKKGNYQEGYVIIEEDNSQESKICLRFLLKYIIYSVKISQAISEQISDCDNAMADGFGWIPPLALIDLLGGKNEVNLLCQKILNKDCQDLLKDLPKSKFDYRKFIKAKI